MDLEKFDIFLQEGQKSKKYLELDKEIENAKDSKERMSILKKIIALNKKKEISQSEFGVLSGKIIKRKGWD